MPVTAEQLEGGDVGVTLDRAERVRLRDRASKRVPVASTPASGYVARPAAELNRTGMWVLVARFVIVRPRRAVPLAPHSAAWLGSGCAASDPGPGAGQVLALGGVEQLDAECGGLHSERAVGMGDRPTGDGARERLAADGDRAGFRAADAPVGVRRKQRADAKPYATVVGLSAGPDTGLELRLALRRADHAGAR